MEYLPLFLLVLLVSFGLRTVDETTMMLLTGLTLIFASTLAFYVQWITWERALEKYKNDEWRNK
jgi:hypothetical protein